MVDSGVLKAAGLASVISHPREEVERIERATAP
jgi:hypothetical protein